MIDFQLVRPEFVAEYLANPEADGRWKLLEAHFTSPDHPPTSELDDSHHIPGAIHVHPSYLEAGTDRSKYYPAYEHPADGNLLPDRELALAIHRLGITPDTLVVVYGREPDGAMAAARLVWALMYAGVTKIRLLDGGIDAWLADGRTASPHIETVSNIGRNDGRLTVSTSLWRTCPEILATTAEVREISKARGISASKLVDVRSYGEWDGTLPHCYPFFSKAGHIPTAEFQGDWENLVDKKTHKLGPMLGTVARRWHKARIIDPGVEELKTTLIFYCGTGWRSSIAFLVGLLLGLRAKNYDSGFYGWSWNAEHEIAKGNSNSTRSILLPFTNLRK